MEFYHLKGPIIDSTSEISITDYDHDHDDYYGDGYTFFRSTLSKLKISEVNNIVDYIDEDFFVVSIQSDYGYSFTGHLSKKVEKFNNDQFSLKSLNLSPIINTALLKTLSYNKKKITNSPKDGFENHYLKVFIIKKENSKNINIIHKSSVVF